METKKRTYQEKEIAAEYLFRNDGPFWHLVTSGHEQEIIFTKDDEFRFCMNQIPLCAMPISIGIIAFSVMDNHFHCIYSGTRETGEYFIRQLRIRLKRYYAKMGRKISIYENYKLIPILSLKSLRNEIIYVHRNGYVACSDITPFSYQWGTGYCYFNVSYDHLFGVNFNNLKYDDKRRICMSRVVRYPEEWLFGRGIILPSSYCRINDGQNLYRDAHQYFNLLSRDYEAFCEEGRRLGGEIILTDEEMFSAACSYSRKMYNVEYPSSIPDSKKIEMARVMFKEYRATPSQIKRILKLDAYVINTLFPDPK